MVRHEIDSNSTWVEAMLSRTKQAMLIAQEHALKRIQAAGLNPIHQILDNEASAKYKDAIIKSSMTYQLVPTNDH